MEKTLLKKGDIIRLEKGMQVFAQLPECVLSEDKPFSTRNVEKVVIIGEVYKRGAASKIESMEKIRRAIKDIVTVSDEQVKNFIDSLELDFSAKEFDTSTYEGEYVVDYEYLFTPDLLKDCGFPIFNIEALKNNHRVHCYKKDDPSIQVEFFQTGSLWGTIPGIEPINK